MWPSERGGLIIHCHGSSKGTALDTEGPVLVACLLQHLSGSGLALPLQLVSQHSQLHGNGFFDLCPSF
jgi:hypothetical protein